MDLKKLLFIVAIFFFGFFAHFWYDQNNVHCGDQFNFINNQFSCGQKQVINKKDYIDLKERLLDYIADQKFIGKAEFVSVYFRDLEAGPTMGIDQFVDYIPASLLKVPLALTYFVLAEDDPQILENNIKYRDGVKDGLLTQTFKPKDPLIEGQLYTVKELIGKMIVDSDNISAEVLFEYLNTFEDKNLLHQTYRDLGILEMGSDLNKEAVNTKNYGSIFRILYNVSFLNPEYSEKFLRSLSKSNFEKGLRMGVPDEVVIAHKFGERFLANNEKQLHDCGIIYYPQNPYLLCVMTRGSDFKDLATIIGHISTEFYKEIESRRLD